MSLPYNVRYLADAINAPGTQTGVFLPPLRPVKTFQSITTGKSVVTIQVSNNNSDWINYIQLTDNDCFSDTMGYAYYRAVVTAVTGKVTVLAGF